MSDSLVGALQKARISANRGFIAWVTERAGINEYEARANASKPYIVARRRDAGRELHIYFGYTTGFASDEEIRNLFGDLVVPMYDDKLGLWWVAHPENSIREGNARSGNKGREADFCPCGMQRSLTGVCDGCD